MYFESNRTRKLHLISVTLNILSYTVYKIIEKKILKLNYKKLKNESLIACLVSGVVAVESRTQRMFQRGAL